MTSPKPLNDTHLLPQQFVTTSGKHDEAAPQGKRTFSKRGRLRIGITIAPSVQVHPIKGAIMSFPFRSSSIFTFHVLLVCLGCGKGPVDVSRTEGPAFEVPGSSADGAPSSSEGGADRGGASASPSSGGNGNGTAGVLTAGIWDDNVNYDFFEAYRQTVAKTEGLPDLSETEQSSSHQTAQSASKEKVKSLDIALVIDTTGSMGDEIAYLQAEFAAISRTLATSFPDISQRWALVNYRDVSDAFVVRGVDFGTDTSWFQKALDQLGAGGGGDFPEAPDQALAHAAKLSWNPEPGAAHLVFWVADAPHHAENAKAMSAALRALKASNVHVYPVASSGIDDLTEYTMRAAAQLTLGRYIFLTDDSGVGGPHQEPSIPCYWVTKLDHAILRSVKSEIAGQPVVIDPATVVRAQGQPRDGRCQVSNGAQPLIF